MVSLRKLNVFRRGFCAAGRKFAQAGLFVLVAAGTSPGAQAGETCPLASQRPMLVAELFFGRAMPHGASVSDAAWSAFAAREIAHAFPDGFTVEDGSGSWTDPVSHRLIRERTKILIVAAPRDGMEAKLDGIVSAYRSEFHQSSVGLVTSEACGRF